MALENLKADLRLADRRGLFVLSHPDLPGGVALTNEGRVLRYDPEIDPLVRGKRVLAILRKLPPA